jgi:hypothetical protein
VEVRGEVERLGEGSGLKNGGETVMEWSARRAAALGFACSARGARKGTTKAKRDWLLERLQRLMQCWDSPERRRVAAPALSPPLKKNRGDDRSNRRPIPV